MDFLGRYYTESLFSSLLINQFSINSPKNIIDLGVGGGSLIKAALSRWENASYFAGDIDKKSVAKIKTELPTVNSFHLNTLKDDISNKLNLLKGSVDIGVCNPPYLKIKNNISHDLLFEGANLVECKHLKIITSDIIFLARNLEMLKEKGELGIIIPDSLVTGKNFFHLRNAILKEHNLKAIIELPEKIFSKTEALTHILLIEKGGTTAAKSSVFLASKEGEIIDKVEVDSDSLSERMDFKYHSWKNKAYSKAKVKFLKDFKCEIKRGRQTHKELKESSDNFIHTTEILNKKSNQALKNRLEKNDKFLLTQAGDILLARVGRGCTGKICMVSRGRVPISDCVYLIRVPEKYRTKIWNSFISLEGQKWLKANAHGVCAKVISKKDLLNFPIF